MNSVLLDSFYTLICGYVESDDGGTSLMAFRVPSIVAMETASVNERNLIANDLV